MTNTASALIWSGCSYGEVYASCRSESELLDALGNAVGASAADLAQSLRPLGLIERVSLAAVKTLAPARYEEHWSVQTRVFSESVVFIARQLRDLFARSHGLSEQAEYVYREAVRVAGSALAARVGMPQERAEYFTQTLSHVVLQHAHFPPHDDGEALVRLVAARGKKLTIQEAVSFVKQLVGDDPLRRTEPWAFVRRWLSLHEEPAWASAVATA